MSYLVKVMEAEDIEDGFDFMDCENVLEAWEEGRVLPNFTPGYIYERDNFIDGVIRYTEIYSPEKGFEIKDFFPKKLLIYIKKINDEATS